MAAEHYTGATRPHYPDTWTAWVKDLVSGLLHPDPLMRLGTGEGGMEAIKNHAWFQVRTPVFSSICACSVHASHNCSPVCAHLDVAVLGNVLSSNCSNHVGDVNCGADKFV